MVFIKTKLKIIFDISVSHILQTLCNSIDFLPTSKFLRVTDGFGLSSVEKDDMALLGGEHLCTKLANIQY